jgi:hypothetical protein
MPMTFVRFLTQFLNEDDPIGDLARDARDDVRVSKRWGFNKFMEHLGNMNACEAARLSAYRCLNLYTAYLATQANRNI